MNEVYLESYRAMMSGMYSGGVIGEDEIASIAMPWAFMWMYGTEDGPFHVGRICQKGEDLCILYHQYWGRTWTRVMKRW